LKILLFAGEKSGELYLNYLVRILKNCSSVNLYIINKNIATVGFSEGIKKLFLFLSYLKKIAREIKNYEPDVFIPIGFSNFNLFLIRKIKNKKTKIIYFAPPQIWAWGKNRYKLLKKYVDKVICLFPFEKDFYEKLGIRAIYLGNPLLAIVKVNLEKEEIKKKYGIKDEKVITLMPGSRNEEIKRNLPAFLKICEKLKKDFLLKAFILGIKELNYQKFNFSNLPIIYEDHYELISISDLVLTSFGTATLEIALLNRPFIALYFPSLLNSIFGKFLLRTKYFSLPNIILNKKIFPEYVNPNLTEVYQKAKEILNKNLDYSYYSQKIKYILTFKQT